MSGAFGVVAGGESRRHGARGAALLLVLILLLGAGARTARADGDPASDVLALQTMFVPGDANVPAPQRSQLAALLAEARARGYPLRVAIIASRTDLGSITELWRQPTSYARFLGQELGLVFRGDLLVVMPNGAAAVAVDARGVRTVPLSTRVPGAALGAFAVSSSEQLAAGAGHPLPIPAAVGAAATGSSGPLPGIVLAAGAILVAAAWTASLRARPLGRRARPLA